MPTNYQGDGTSFVAVVPVIADGEYLSEKILAPGIRRLADQSAYLYRKIPQLYSHAADDNVGPLYTYTGATALQSTIAAGLKVDVPSCVIGDKIEIFGYMTATRTLGVTPGFDVYIDAIDNALGTPAAEAHVPGAHFGTSAAMVSDGNVNLWMLSGVWTVAVAGTTRLAFAVKTTGDDGFVINFSATLNAIRSP